MFVCPMCNKDCIPLGTNVIGMEIQEYDDKNGWVSMEEIFPTECKARTAMSLIKEDGIKRRVYGVLERRKFSRFEVKA